MKRILKSSIIIICVLFAVGLTGCSCSNQERIYYSGNTNSIDKDFLKNTGLIIGEYEIILPVSIDELPFDNNKNTCYFLSGDKYVFNDNIKVKPNQMICCDAVSMSSVNERNRNGTYYAVNDSGKDNLPKYCTVVGVTIYTKYLNNGNYISIGNDTITKDTSYEEICRILRDNVASPDMIVERDNYCVAVYNDVLYKVSNSSQDGVEVVIRVDKSINDADNINDIPWDKYR